MVDSFGTLSEVAAVCVVKASAAAACQATRKKVENNGEGTLFEIRFESSFPGFGRLLLTICPREARRVVMTHPVDGPATSAPDRGTGVLFPRRRERRCGL